MFIQRNIKLIHLSSHWSLCLSSLRNDLSELSLQVTQVTDSLLLEVITSYNQQTAVIFMWSPKISLNFTDNFTHFTVLIIATFLICGLTLFIASSYPFVLILMFSFSLKCPFFFDVYSLDIFIENSNIPSLSSFCKT